MTLQGLVVGLVFLQVLSIASVPQNTLHAYVFDDVRVVGANAWTRAFWLLYMGATIARLLQEDGRAWHYFILLVVKYFA